MTKNNQQPVPGLRRTGLCGSDKTNRNKVRSWPWPQFWPILQNWSANQFKLSSLNVLWWRRGPKVDCWPHLV